MRSLTDRRFAGLAALCLSLWCWAGPAQAERVTIFAAASLKTVLDQVIVAYSRGSEDEIVASYAGTSVLARQVSLGAPAHIILSASADWMDWLEELGAIDGRSRVEIARNRLVLIASAETPAIPATAEAIGAQLGQQRVAMALVDAVPAGIYGKAALSHMGLWDQIAPQVAQTDNVRAALALVATGVVPYGIVYATDARADARVSVMTKFPDGSHPPITYPAALVADHGTAAAQAFLSFLQTEAAQAVFAAQGFLPREAPS